MTCRQFVPDVIDHARGIALDLARLDEVTGHLRSCASCARLAERERAMSAALRRVASEVETPEAGPREYFTLMAAFDASTRRSRRMPLTVGLSLAASAVIVIGLSVGWKSDAPVPVPPPAADAQFVVLPGADALPRFESGQVIRVEIPSPDGVITADVLVGQDGLARAVRIVQ